MIVAALDVTRWLIPYLTVAVMVSAPVTWVAAHWGLNPLKRVASQASRIDMNSLHQRLDATHVSTEVYPLVEAVNGALARLDEGVAQQRRFTANAAHELRTPVAILTARIDAPKEPSFLTDLECDARRIHAIVEQMLSTARLNEHRADVQERVDLMEVARSTVADSALLAIKRRRQINLEGPEAAVYARGNQFALESVLRNLIDNALRTEPEGGTVIVRVAPEATVEVLDHGEGVAEPDREAIFEAFWRKCETTPGTGLGLAIARQLMELQGGRIWVEETPGGGATFKLAFLRAISN
ncbi:MAG: sensor histidine kinase [Methylocystis sp.]